jgi:hypothetical protein
MRTVAQLTLDDILERKRRARSELARLPFDKKIEIVESLRERLEPFQANRARCVADRAKAAAE